MKDHYHIDNCIYTCVHELIESSYNCTLKGFYQINSNLDTCQNVRYLLDEIVVPECRLQCLEGCETTRYDALVGKTENTDATALTVKFSTMSHLELSQLPKTSLTSFVSEFGVTLGLFLGMSFQSFIEIIEVLIKVFNNVSI